MPNTLDAELLFTPPSSELRFLPEGPYPLSEGTMSWVAIAHAADRPQGSLNVFDFATRQNREYPLTGRPGFAFPTSRVGTFVVGMERSLGLLELANGKFTPLAEGIDRDVQETIVNDGECFDQGIVFGCKDLHFKTKRAGLYLWRKADAKLIQLRNDQICSNGKVLLTAEGGHTLLDIDTPTKSVKRYQLDVATGTLSEGEVVLDLAGVDAFPDGMIGTPDGRSVIISFYNPADVEAGETHQYNLANGSLETVWRTPGSPRNTCPQLLRVNGAVRLVITTAVEGMSEQQLQQHPHAGCLFMGETSFSELPPTPVYEL